MGAKKGESLQIRGNWMNPVEDDDPLYNSYTRVATENDEMEYVTTQPNRIAMENDETEMIASDAPMSLHTSEWSREQNDDLNYELQISDSIPPLELGVWSQEVLEAFSNLPDFTPEQAEALIILLGSSPTGQLCSVRDYMVAFQSQPDPSRHLRALTQQLKMIARTDVVRVLHRQKGALQWLGPVLPEEMLIRDLAPSLWVLLATAISIPHPNGYSWNWLAHKVGISSTFAYKWREKDNPATEVLKSWQVTREATVGKLFDLLIDKREDLAAML